MLQSGHGSRDRRTDGRTDRRTDGQTDGVKPIYPPTTSLFGGYNYESQSIVAWPLINKWKFLEANYGLDEFEQHRKTKQTHSPLLQTVMLWGTVCEAMPWCISDQNDQLLFDNHSCPERKQMKHERSLEKLRPQPLTPEPLFTKSYNILSEAGVYTKFSGRLSEEPFPWLIQKFPCILIFKTGQPGCQLNLSKGQIRLDLTSGRPLV